MASDPALDEYRQLRDEKAADWRLITQTTVATLATSGAVFAAALSVKSYALMVVAPFPFFLGVLYMIQSALLQVRLIAFIGSRAPEDALNYERHVIEASQDATARPWLRGTRSWDWWRYVATVFGVLMALFPLAVRLEHLRGFRTHCPGLYTAVGIAFALLFFVATSCLSARVRDARAFWVTYWERHSR